MTEKIIAKYVCKYCGSEFDHDDAGLELCTQCERSHKTPVSCAALAWDKGSLSVCNHIRDELKPNYPKFITVRMSNGRDVPYTRGVVSKAVSKAPWNE